VPIPDSPLTQIRVAPILLARSSAADPVPLRDPRKQDRRNLQAGFIDQDDQAGAFQGL
jgi:hypothetical protein